MIGRRSPIAILTERQRARLVRSLEPYIDPVAVTAMRYWKPLTEDAVASLKSAGPLDELVLLPLIPTIPTPLRSAALRNGAASTANLSTRFPNAALKPFTIIRCTSKL